jgi:predicted component of type VI protein secretion system
MILAQLKKATNGWVVKEIAYSKTNREENLTIHMNFESAVEQIAKIFNERVKVTPAGDVKLIE